MNKKVSKIIMILSMIVVLLPWKISNAADTAISVDSVKAKVGEEIIVNITLNGSLTIAGFSTEIKFDKSKLEVVETQTGKVLTDLGSTLIKTDPIEANISGSVVFVSASASNNKLGSGTIGTIIFKVKEGVTEQQTLQVITDMQDENGQDVTIKNVAGKIIVEKNAEQEQPEEPITNSPTAEEESKQKNQEEKAEENSQKLQNSDQTVSPRKLPKTGMSYVVIITIIVLLILLVFIFTKYKSLKDVK